MVRRLFRVGRVSQFSAALASFVLLLSTVPAPPAGAVEPVIVAAQPAAAPNVVCSWVLPDMDLDAANAVQYTDGEGRGDDNPSLGPDGGPVCSGGDPTGRDGTNLVQVIANPGDAPSVRLVGLWSAVDRPGGVDSGTLVYWDLFYPDGNFKARIDGVAVDDGCASLALPEAGDPTANAIAAAVTTGQVDDTAAAALEDRCRARVLDAYTGLFGLSFNEPCGSYTVESHAVGPAGETVQTSTIAVDCFQHLAIDTAGIDWGTLVPGTSKVVTGDLDPASGGAPTLVNIGSGGLNLGVRFAPMVPVDADSGAPLTDGVPIDRFGAVFGNNPAAMQRLDPIAAGSDAWFDSASTRTMCAGDLGRLDLLIHPPEILSEGSYRGSFEILVRPDDASGGFSCNNDQGVYGGSWFDGDTYVGNQRSAGVGVARPAPLEAPTFPPPADATDGDTSDVAPADDDASTDPASSPTDGGGSVGTSGSTGPATTTTTASTTRPAGGSTTTVPVTTTTIPPTTRTTTVPGATTTTTAPPPSSGGGGGGVVDPPAEPELPLPRVVIMPALDATGAMTGFDFGLVLMESDPDDIDAPAPPLGPVADLTDLEEELIIAACFPLLDVDMDEDGYNDGDTDRDGVADHTEVWVFYCGSGLDLAAIADLVPGRLEELGIPLQDEPDSANHPQGP